MTHLLVVEDDPSMRRTLELTLRAHGYTVSVTGNGEDALVMAGRQPPDLVLLDLGLPGIDGMSVITGMRAWCAAPIIVLSARDAEADKVAALDLGANDYVTKPFGAGELLARIRAALRSISSAPTVRELGPLRVDFANRSVSRTDASSNADIHLTPIEWAVLEHLCRHAGRLVSTRDLLTALWGRSTSAEANALRVHVAHLRQKIEVDPSRPRYVLTEPGAGYRLDDSGAP